MSRLIAFWSPAGAGATTLALNTAAALATRHLHLVAADFNFTAPTLALYADLLPHQDPGRACLSRLIPALDGGRLALDDVMRLLQTGPGFSVLPGALDAIGASRLTEGHVKRLAAVLAGRFDLVLADLAPVLESPGCLPLLEMADRIVLVTGPELSARFLTRRALIPLLGMGWASKISLVLNRAPQGMAATVAQELGLPVAIQIPDVKMMPGLTESGRIAYGSQSTFQPLAPYRSAVEQVAALIGRGG